MKNQKFLQAATVATVAAVAASSLVAGTEATAADVTLKDVAGHPDAAAINALIEKGMINGYTDGTFKPDRALTRYDITLIIGRYLVQLGYHIPTNAQSSMRFNDLTSKSDRVLLNYAALLADEGILVGDTGKRLNAYSPLTREQLALILTRAFSIIDDFDYVSHVQNQTFLREYLDTLTLSVAAQKAIDVIDYYGISVDERFFPKEYATRGQFAKMTYKMMQLKEFGTVEDLRIVRTTVLSPNRVKFTLSNGSAHEIRLDEPLQENVPTTVTTMIGGRTFTETVTYKVEQVKVLNVENLNSGQFVVYFNQPVDLVDTYIDQTYYTYDISKFFTLRNSAGNIVRLQKGEISEDGKAFIITIEDKTALRGTFHLTIDGVHGTTGGSLPTFENSYYFVADTQRPTIVGNEFIGNNLVKVTFSEPVYTSNSSITYKYGTETVTGVVARYQDATWNPYKNTTEVIFNLNNVRYRYGNLPNFGRVDVAINGLRDLAGNFLSSDVYAFSVNKSGPDNVAPKLSGVEQVGAKQFKLTFNEEMSRIYAYQLEVRSANFDYIVEDVTPVADDATSFIVTVDDFLEGTVSISSHDTYRIKDATGTSGKFTTNATFQYDTSPAVILKTQVARENNLEYLFVEFDKNVDIRKNASAILYGQYVYGQRTYPVDDENKASVYPVKDNRKLVKIPLYELVATYDRQGAQFIGELDLTNIFNEYNEEVFAQQVKFARNTDYNFHSERLEIVSVDTSRTSQQIKDNNLVVITFNHPVNKQFAIDDYNYELFGNTIKTIQVNETDPYKVELVLDQTISGPTEPYLYVWNLRGDSSIYTMEPYYEQIYLTENVAPIYRSYSIQNNKQIKLTFSEALSTIASDTFTVLNANGEKYDVQAINDPTDSSKIVLTFTQPLRSGATITIKHQTNRKLYDAYNNEGVFNDVKFTLPISFPIN